MIYITIYITMVIAAAIIAGNKGRSRIGWVLLTALFGIFALLILACLKNLTPAK